MKWSMPKRQCPLWGHGRELTRSERVSAFNFVDIHPDARNLVRVVCMRSGVFLITPDTIFERRAGCEQPAFWYALPRGKWVAVGSLPSVLAKTAWAKASRSERRIRE